MRYEHWPDHSPAKKGCECIGCRRNRAIERLADASLSAALAHAQSRFEGAFEDGLESSWNFEAATSEGRIRLPGTFKGWKNPTALEVVLSAQAPAAFRTSNSKSLYRIYEEGRQIPLYIGMALREPIQKRVLSHVRGLLLKSGARKLDPSLMAQLAKQTSEIEKFRILASQPGMKGRIKVQHAAVEPDGGYTIDAKFLHAFETALQLLEKPRSYVGSARTFEFEPG
jgi:hypothetical protein